MNEMGDFVKPFAASFVLLLLVGATSDKTLSPRGGGGVRHQSTDRVSGL